MYLVGVRPVLVLGPVRGVGEGFVAAFVLADVGFLSGVRAQVGFQVLQTGVGLRAALKLQRENKEWLLNCSEETWIIVQSITSFHSYCSILKFAFHESRYSLLIMHVRF